MRKNDRPRLSVFRSAKHFYCQIIDDVAGKTLVSASTVEADLRTGGKKGSKMATGNSAAAIAVGKLLASRALAVGVQEVCLDRGRFKYHGRIAAMANAAREAGLQF